MDINSLFFWWPRLRDEKMPKTVGVLFDIADAFPMLDGNLAPDLPWAAFRGAIEAVGFPAFVRTDLSSAKHSGPSAYRVDSFADLSRVVHATMEDNCMKNLDLKISGFVFRQWLDLAGRFEAFHGHPIAPEVRIFIEPTGEDLAVSDTYFYWPEEAFERHCKHPDWRTLRRGMEDETMVPKIIRPLEHRAIEAVKNIGFAEWSVDFARDKNGNWWLIDMALAKNSWKPNHPTTENE